MYIKLTYIEFKFYSRLIINLIKYYQLYKPIEIFWKQSNYKITKGWSGFAIKSICNFRTDFQIILIIKLFKKYRINVKRKDAFWYDLKTRRYIIIFTK
jgi:hypothetical protein